METLINFLMGFSTALLPAMIFIAYFLHKNGHEVTSILEKQLHETVSALNTSRESLVTFKRRLINSEKNNIELTKIQDNLKAEVDQLKAEIAEMEIRASKTTVTTVETVNIDRPSLKSDENLVQSTAPLVETIEDPTEWVRQQLDSVKAQLGSIKQEIKEFYPGYVYVLSNQECFGAGQLYIQATKRLEPMDTVRNLTDDPKIFNFDVHMVLFNEDAPALKEQLQDALKENCLLSQKYDVKLFSSTVAEVSKALSELQAKREETQKQQELSHSKVVDLHPEVAVKSSLKNVA